MATTQHTVTQTEELSTIVEGDGLIINHRQHDRLPMLCYRDIRGGRPVFTPTPHVRSSRDPEGLLTSFEVTFENDAAVQDNHFQGYGITVLWGDVDGTLLLALEATGMRLVMPWKDGYKDPVTGRMLENVVPIARVTRESEWLTKAQLDERD